MRYCAFVSLLFIVAPLVAVAQKPDANIPGEKLEQAFQSLTSNSLQGLRSSRAENVEIEAKGYQGVIKEVEPSQSPTIVKFHLVGGCPIDAVQVMPSQPPLCLGVKIWGQLVNPNGSDGPLVNLAKYKWQRRQRFWLWLESAVPLQVSLFENFPNQPANAKQFSPDPNYPETFQTVMPGQPYRFPVMIEMEDHLFDEYMSIVVVRADSQCLPINGNVSQATATACAQAIVSVNGQAASGQAIAGPAFGQAVAQASLATIQSGAAPVAGAALPSNPQLAGVVGPDGTLKGEVMAKTAAVMKELNAAAYASPAMKPHLVCLPPSTMPPHSFQPADVAELWMGPGQVGQIEIVMHKD